MEWTLKHLWNKKYNCNAISLNNYNAINLNNCGI